MALWKPVQIDNVSMNSLEGLIGIEVCTNYDENILSAAHRSIETDTNKNKKNTKRKLEPKQEKKCRKNLILDLSPSRQGCTYEKRILSRTNFENDLDLENIKLWTHLPIQQSLLKALDNLKFREPTPIQSLTLPAAVLGKRDILGAAETGSGKTLAFCLPMLYGILKLKENAQLSTTHDKEMASEVDIDDDEMEDSKFYENGAELIQCYQNVKFPEDMYQKPLYGLILTPTRELAVQVKQHLDNLAQYTDISTALVIGGMAVEKQLRVLKKGPEIIVATPGRLWELLEEGNQHLLQINNIRFLAIDETDRMLEKGHFQELLKILERINANVVNNRQTFVFSATLTLIHELPKHVLIKKKIRNNRRISDMTVAKKLQKIIETLHITNPKVVDITEKKGTPSTLTECKITCDINEKDYYVYYFLMKHPGKTLIFCNSIGCVRRLTKILSLLNCNVAALHSSLQQRQRLKNLDKFKGGENYALIATDVAARGLDISCIQHVIHYQVPRSSESYVHRSGRTARASEEGITVLLLEPNELQQYLRLCRTLQRSEDFPIFPIEQDFLAAVKERVNLARELDKLELNVRKTKADIGWIQKAAEEMDIIVDDDMCVKRNTTASHVYKNAAEAKRKQLNALLGKPIISRTLARKYLPALNSNHQERVVTNAIEVMKNAIKTNDIKRSIKSKRLFKSKIRREPLQICNNVK